MSNYVYWPQAYPSKKFDTFKECVKHMQFVKDNDPKLWLSYFTNIGVFICRRHRFNGDLALLEFPDKNRRKQYRDYVTKYKAQSRNARLQESQTKIYY